MKKWASQVRKLGGVEVREWAAEVRHWADCGENGRPNRLESKSEKMGGTWHQASGSSSKRDQSRHCRANAPGGRHGSFRARHRRFCISAGDFLSQVSCSFSTERPFLMAMTSTMKSVR